MIRVHIVHGPWSETNTRAFFAPVFRCRRELHEAGVTVRFFAAPSAAATDADVLVIDDKHYGATWNSQSGMVLDTLAALRRQVARLVYADLGDSSGLIRVPALHAVHAYWKGFLLRDRAAYGVAHYGGRLFTDHYHRVDGVVDADELRADPVPAEALGKLRLSWSYGLVNHGLLANRASSLFSRWPWPRLLDLPLQLADPAAPRPLTLSCRMGIGHRRASVVHQRRRLRALLGDRVPTARVGRRAFFAEMRQSRLVLSPFGWGEFAYRDYEAFVGGAALVKPSMSHVETFPDYYRDGETMLAIGWDMADLDSTLARALDHPRETQDIARAAQNMYRYHVATADGRRAFARHFQSLVANGPGLAA